MDNENRIIGTPYDDAFPTMLVDCIRLVIPVINEVFGKHYTGDEEIIQRPNEHFIMRQDDEEKRVTDGNYISLFWNGWTNMPTEDNCLTTIEERSLK